MLLKNPQTRFEEIYPIYKESFPDIERRTKDDQKRVFGNPCYGVRAIEEEGKILAFLGYWNLPSCVFFGASGHGGSVQGQRIWKTTGAGGHERNRKACVFGNRASH